MRIRFSLLVASLAALWLLPALGRADEKTPALELVLTCDEKEYAEGVHPKFTAKLKNVSKEDVYVIASLDGSDDGRRFPRYLATATVNDEKVGLNQSGRCGNKNAIKDADVKKLAPGESIEPIGGGTFGQHELASTFKFDKPGIYAVTLTYDTDEKDDAKFDGDLGKNEHKMLAKVLRTKVVSQTLHFTVTKK
jgi:hypothetical protein